MSWELIRYDDYTTPLIQSDLEEMEKTKASTGQKVKDTTVENASVKTMDIDDQNLNSNASSETQTKKVIDLTLEKTLDTNGCGDVVGKKEQNADCFLEKTNEKTVVEKENENPVCNGEPEREDIKKNPEGTDGKFLALKLQFQLPPSCYATTALRELLSCDSSYQAQAQLNANFNQKTITNSK